AAAMAMSSVTVVTNSLLLKRMNPKTPDQLEEEKLLTEKNAIDPVCGMEVVPGKSFESTHDGKKYYFCNMSCKAAFDADPDKYLAPGAAKAMPAGSEGKQTIAGKESPVVLQESIEAGDYVLYCSTCGAVQELPQHCSRPMHPEGDQLVCWMGADCGAQAVPEHHGHPMVLRRREELNEDNNLAKAKQQGDVKKMAMLKCDVCGETQEVPMHCGQPMHQEDDKLVCWMGASCGEVDVPVHCDQPMTLVEEE
ncbi:MAG TPA: YHS domain-containing protein, partial [Candidatus Lokiarchaeia archaeon]|nr:YHS domain-containing protein [Candidatus Lokiarchaeia archaeon]